MSAINTNYNNTLFPDDVLYEIFSHLDCKSLGRVEQVCKTWQSNTGKVWQVFVRRDFPQQNPTLPSNAKQIYYNNLISTGLNRIQNLIEQNALLQDDVESPKQKNCKITGKKGCCVIWILASTITIVVLAGALSNFFNPE